MAPARGRFAWLLIALASCGGGGASGPAGPGPGGDDCAPEDRASAAPGALEASVTNTLRAEAGIESIFGADTQGLLDEADALRLEASSEALLGVGVAEPPEDVPGPGGLCAAQWGLTTQAWANRALAMSLAVNTLPVAIDGVPFSGTLEGTGLRSSETGDPALSASYNLYMEGDGKSGAAVEIRGVLNISSPTNGSIHETNETRVEIDVCPDAEGHAKGKVHFKFGGIATPASGDPWTYGTTIDSTFRFEVDDQAEIARLVIDSRMDYRITGASAASVAGNGSVTFTGDRVTAADLGWEHRDGSLEAIGTVQREIFNAALVAALVARDKAREKWRGGTCVEVATDHMGGSVKARKVVPITVRARQKLEGRDLDVDIQGWLTGGTSLSPNTRRVPSPASFEYTAPEDGQTSTVHFESVSKRGIGRKDLVFTAAGGWTGQITWTVSGSGSHGDQQYTFSKTGNGGGEIRLKPGPHGTVEVESATFTYTLQQYDTWSSSYDQGECHYTGYQVTQGTMTGTGTEGALVIFAQNDATTFSLVAGVPFGTVTGTITTDASGTASPEDLCDQPAPYHSSSEASAPLPSGAFQVQVMSSNPDSVSGSTSVHVDGDPPLDWEFSYSLSR